MIHDILEKILDFNDGECSQDAKDANEMFDTIERLDINGAFEKFISNFDKDWVRIAEPRICSEDIKNFEIDADSVDVFRFTSHNCGIPKTTGTNFINIINNKKFAPYANRYVLDVKCSVVSESSYLGIGYEDFLMKIANVMKTSSETLSKSNYSYFAQQKRYIVNLTLDFEGRELSQEMFDNLVSSIYKECDISICNASIPSKLSLEKLLSNTDATNMWFNDCYFGQGFKEISNSDVTAYDDTTGKFRIENFKKKQTKDKIVVFKDDYGAYSPISYNAKHVRIVNKRRFAGNVPYYGDFYAIFPGNYSIKENEFSITYTFSNTKSSIDTLRLLMTCCKGDYKKLDLPVIKGRFSMP